MEFVADTHAVIWHLMKPAALGSSARRALEAADLDQNLVYIPAVVVSEILMVAEKGRLSGLTSDLALKHLARMERSTNYRLTSLTPDVVMASANLKAIPDIFDRLIVAEALQRGVPLLTKDTLIHGSGLVTVVWD